MRISDWRSDVCSSDLGALGIVIALRRPDWLGLKGDASSVTDLPRPRLGATLRTVAIWLLVWAAPMALVLALLGRSHVFWDIGAFFSQLAIVTFGGAYAVLAYRSEERRVGKECVSTCRSRWSP